MEQTEQEFRDIERDRDTNVPEGVPCWRCDGTGADATISDGECPECRGTGETHA